MESTNFSLFRIGGIVPEKNLEMKHVLMWEWQGTTGSQKSVPLDLVKREGMVYLKNHLIVSFI